MVASFYRDIQPENLPVPKGQIMQLIQYTLGEDTQIDKLTQLISMNPVLTAQLLGMVNSSFFGFRQQVKTISDAVVAMGLKSLRNLILCFAVKETLSKNDIPGFDIDIFWEDSIRRGGGSPTASGKRAGRTRVYCGDATGYRLADPVFHGA